MFGALWLYVSKKRRHVSIIRCSQWRVCWGRRMSTSPAFPHWSVAFWIEKHSGVSVKLFTERTTPLQNEKWENTLWGYFSKNDYKLFMTCENKTVHIHAKYFQSRGRNWLKNKKHARKSFNNISYKLRHFWRLNLWKCKINAWLAYLSSHFLLGPFGTDDTWTLHRLSNDRYVTNERLLTEPFLQLFIRFWTHAKLNWIRIGSIAWQFWTTLQDEPPFASALGTYLASP